MAIRKKFIGNEQVDGSKVLLLNNETLKSKDASGASIDLLKLDAAGKLQMLAHPEVAADAAFDNQLVRKSQLDALALPESQRKYVNYVNGSDVTGNGSQLKPWKTVSYACSQITDSVQVVSNATWTSGSNVVTVDSTSGLVVGQLVTHASGSSIGFASGAAFITQILSANTIQISQTASATRGAAYTGTTTVADLTGLTGSTTNASRNITDISSTASLLVGMRVTGSGIPANATISSILSSTSIQISANATATASGVALTFSRNNFITGLSSTTGLASGQVISGPGIPSGTTISAVLASSNAVRISQNATTDNTGALYNFGFLALTFRKAYLIEFDGQGIYDTVALPSFVMLVGKNMSTSQIGTVNLTLPAVAQSANTIMNCQINVFNLDSTAVTSAQSTRFFDCTLLDLNCVGKAVGGNQVLLYSTDVLNQLHFKGGYLQVAASNYLQRVRIFHTSNGGSTNYALIQGGQHASSAGTWISGNGALQVIGGVSMSVPVVSWGEESTGVFRGRAFPFSSASNTWTTDVTISIQSAATEVILTGDGVKTISTLISDWNTANPSNLMALVEGNGAQVVPLGTEIVFLNAAKPSLILDSSSYVTESASLQGPVAVAPNARPEGIRYDDRARATFYGFRFYASSYGTAGNSISLAFGDVTLSGSTTNASRNVVVGSTAQLAAGMTVSGAGIPANATISSITNSTTLVISANATATASGVSLTFGSRSIARVVSAWNTANPSNTVSYTSSGSTDARGYDFVPTSGTVILSGGGLFTGSSSTFNVRDAIAQLGQKAKDLAAVDVTFVQEKFVLSGTDISNGYITLANAAIHSSINAYVYRLAIHETDDYTLSTVGGVTRMTFAGSLVSPAQETLVEGDVITVKYARLVG